MHTTIVKLKDGKTYSGPMNTWRPCFNWFTLFGVDKVFSFDECESIVTPNERVSISSPLEGEICDDLERARKNLEDGRKFGWTQDGKPYPKEKLEWENCSYKKS